eukprot:CAMPEP_0182542298 /NCGR_PEP_ID=MMETSP1323-20130603/29940_1 /TAXON_ID=236787 /ORGANISM="Florenciella parvula, Strain RCC1693" /LENGTH=95 /DNA_ID=CAMNT_0024753139 /DNA_START=120 /DNA_END=408 /DNA_ORIENTATION=+
MSRTEAVNELKVVAVVGAHEPVANQKVNQHHADVRFPVIISPVAQVFHNLVDIHEGETSNLSVDGCGHEVWRQLEIKTEEHVRFEPPAVGVETLV